MIKLTQGRSFVGLSPDHGATITAFTHDGQAMFRTATPMWRTAHDPTAHDPMEVACFPLVPYSNRVRDGQFEHGDTSVQLPNWGGWAHALHGLGWVRSWTVIEVGSAHCLCRYVHMPDSDRREDWPWDFTAEQALSLEDGRLSLTLSITNNSTRSMPAGLGPHPYFPDASKATLQFKAGGVWQSADDLPTEWTDIPERWDFSAGRAVAGASVDHCFTGFDGRAQIDWDGARYGLSIAAGQALGHAVLYVPDEGDYFCFEPVSHMNDALNWVHEIPGTGLQILAPGETFSVETVFTVTD